MAHSRRSLLYLRSFVVACKFAILQLDDLRNFYPEVFKSRYPLRPRRCAHIRREDYSKHCIVSSVGRWTRRWQSVCKFTGSFPQTRTFENTVTLFTWSSGSVYRPSVTRLYNFQDLARTYRFYAILLPHSLYPVSWLQQSSLVRIQVHLSNECLKYVTIISNGWRWWLTPLVDLLKKEGYEAWRQALE